MRVTLDARGDGRTVREGGPSSAGNPIAARTEPTVGQVLACACLMVLAVALGVIGGAIVLATALVALFVGGAGVALFLVAVALWERAAQ